MTYDLYVNGIQFEVSVLERFLTFELITIDDDEGVLKFTTTPGISGGIYNMEIRGTLPDVRSDLLCTDSLLNV